MGRSMLATSKSPVFDFARNYYYFAHKLASDGFDDAQYFLRRTDTVCGVCRLFSAVLEGCGMVERVQKSLQHKYSNRVNIGTACAPFIIAAREGKAAYSSMHVCSIVHTKVCIGSLAHKLEARVQIL